MNKSVTKKVVHQLKTKSISSCRSCYGKNIHEIIEFGNTYVSNFIDDKKLKSIIKSPLTLVICTDCHLVQLRHKGIPGDVLYRHYWYRSGMNQTMRDALADIVSQVMSRIELKNGDIVIDIGSNDGTLLSYYPNHIFGVGFEPAKNLKSYSKGKIDRLFVDFFNADRFVKNYGKYKAKVITSIAMFYDLEDPNTFVHDISECLDENGLWVVQMSYLPLMLEQNAFDNVCHEHLEYYSLVSLSNLLKRHELYIQDVELNDVNGGSFRVYIYKINDTNPKPTKGVSEVLKKENKKGLDTPKPYLAFAKRVSKIKQRVVKIVKSGVKKGQRFYVYGASTKGNTLLQYFGLDSSLIEAAAERNPDKWGLRTVGTNIPIVSEEKGRRAKPDYFLVLPWHFLNEFREREKEYLTSGGKFLVPLPTPRVVGK